MRAVSLICCLIGLTFACGRERHYRRSNRLGGTAAIRRRPPGDGWERRRRATDVKIGREIRWLTIENDDLIEWNFVRGRQTLLSMKRPFVLTTSDPDIKRPSRPHVISDISKWMPFWTQFPRFYRFQYIRAYIRVMYVDLRQRQGSNDRSWLILSNEFWGKFLSFYFPFLRFRVWIESLSLNGIQQCCSHDFTIHDNLHTNQHFKNSLCCYISFMISDW